MVLPKIKPKDGTQISWIVSPTAQQLLSSSGWSDNDSFSSVNKSVLCYSLKLYSCLIAIQSPPDSLGLVLADVQTEGAKVLRHLQKTKCILVTLAQVSNLQ